MTHFKMTREYRDRYAKTYTYAVRRLAKAMRHARNTVLRELDTSLGLEGIAYILAWLLLVQVFLTCVSGRL